MNVSDNVFFIIQSSVYILKLAMLNNVMGLPRPTPELNLDSSTVKESESQLKAAIIILEKIYSEVLVKFSFREDIENQ